MEQDREAFERLADAAEEVGNYANRLYLELNPGLEARLSDRAKKGIRDDLIHHVRQFAAIALRPDDGGLNDYLSWLKVLFEALGLSDEGIPVAFRCVSKAASVRLDPSSAKLFDDLIERAAFIYRRSEPCSNSYLKEGIPEGGIARAYVQALISGRRDLATALVESEVSKGKAIKDIYLELFQPAQREIGRLWHLRHISIGQEHYCTGMTQYLMSTLYSRLFAEGSRNGMTMIAACAEGELHEIGIRMVADLFQAEGWDSRFLGANLPVSALVEEAARSRCDLVALSATIQTNVRWVAAAVAAIRKSCAGGHAPRIVVGGIPFQVPPELWREVGADGTAADCVAAVSLGAALVGEAGHTEPLIKKNA